METDDFEKLRSTYSQMSDEKIREMYETGPAGFGNREIWHLVLAEYDSRDFTVDADDGAPAEIEYIQESITSTPTAKKYMYYWKKGWWPHLWLVVLSIAFWAVELGIGMFVVFVEEPYLYYAVEGLLWFAILVPVGGWLFKEIAENAFPRQGDTGVKALASAIVELESSHDRDPHSIRDNSEELEALHARIGSLLERDGRAV